MSASKTVLGVLQNVEHPLDAEYGAWIVRYFDDSGHEQQIFAPFQQVDTAERSVLQHNKIWAPFFWLSSRPGFIGCFNPGGYGVVVTLQLCDPTSRDWRNVHNLRLCGFLGHHPFFQGLRISNRIRSGQSRDENGWVPGEDWFVEQNNYHDNDLLEYGLIEHEGRDLPHEDEMLVSVKVNYDMNQINTGDALRVRSVASTDTGHEGTSGNGTFALNNPQSQIDFGYRAVHLSTVNSKIITSLFYGKPHNTSYWRLFPDDSCSSGGKQGLKEIQMYPEDFDAAIVGSPAQPWSRLNGWTQYVNAIVNPPTSAGFIPTSAWTSLHNEVLNQCDALDGVRDGIILEPGKCFLNYTNFACGGNSTALNSTTCLTTAQVSTLQKVYRNWTDPSTGEQLFPAFNIGSEFMFAASINGIPYGPAPSYFIYQILNQTSLVLPIEYPVLQINGSANYTEAQLINLVRIADRTDPGMTNASNPNLAPFFNRGGKLVLFVGGTDWLIPTNATHDYYNAVQGALGNVSNSMALYEIPGELE
ncbi:hypothetical protein EMMF5_004181 [Cystobasidiomycetes sp. EMM_F5]